MKKRYYFLFLFFGALASVKIGKLNSKKNLIPRTVLFGPSSKTVARISPDGNYISYLAPLNNDVAALNIWVKSIGKHDDRALTNIKDRSIHNYFWSPDSKYIIYGRDNNGDENWKLYSTNVADGTSTCLTPYENIQAQIIGLSKFHPNTLLVGLNKDNAQLHDVYELDLTSGSLKLIEKNPGTISLWLADKDLKIRAACRPRKDGGIQLLIRKDTQSSWDIAREWDHVDNELSGPLDFSLDGKFLYLTDSKDSNTSRLLKLNLETKELQVIAQDTEYDINNVFINANTYEIEAVSFIKDYEEWKVINPAFEPLLQKLFSIDRGNLYIMGVDDKQDKWVICFEKDTASASFYLYEKSKDEATHLFDLRPEINNYILSPCKPIQFKSRDGFTIRGYLTCPNKVKAQNLPLILLVHGGPWTRDTWGYRAEVQWLANRGYAVLQVNYRGSTGYGKRFVNASYKEWGGKMHEDLLDAVQWAINTKLANPKKIAIYGASYGGYAALVGATFTPDVFCCAIDIVGPSNLLTFLETVPPYWSLCIEQIYKSIGHPIHDKDLLKERSPLFKVKNIKIPLLIAQGAQDPRVKKEESEQIVTALKEHNICHQYILFEDEGHGFSKVKNKLHFYAAAEKFLAQHLGGDYES